MRMKKILSKIALICFFVAASPVTSSIYAFEDESIATVNVVPTLKSVSGGIETTVSDGIKHDFYIYSITGQMVKSVSLDDTSTIDLPQGCYIVKCESWSKKIVVR